MATPDTTAVTQEDTELVDEHEDKPTAARERKRDGRKFLHSKAMQKMAGMLDPLLSITCKRWNYVK